MIEVGMDKFMGGWQIRILKPLSGGFFYAEIILRIDFNLNPCLLFHG